MKTPTGISTISGERNFEVSGNVWSIMFVQGARTCLFLKEQITIKIEK